jgi:hypothetical protein
MGEIKVTVQTEKRLDVISNLAVAVKELSKALGIGTHVSLTNCTFSGGDPAVSIDTSEETTETIIEKTE